MEIVSAGGETVEFVIGKYIFNSHSQTLSYPEGSFKLTLTPKEAQLLTILALNLNKVVNHSFALQTIWREVTCHTNRSMNVYIGKLRKYLKDDPNVRIVNKHGQGFKLVVD